MQTGVEACFFSRIVDNQGMFVALRVSDGQGGYIYVIADQEKMSLNQELRFVWGSATVPQYNLTVGLMELGINLLIRYTYLKWEGTC